MIQYVSRNLLNVAKYDACIQDSLQSRVYAFSWYLDIVADNWSVLVLNDYEVVMPITWRKKYGIKYIYPPFWTLELGIFSRYELTDCKVFYNLLFDKFRFVELRLNTQNKFSNPSNFLIKKQMQTLELKAGYAEIYDSYRKDRKKDLLKATKATLKEQWHNDIEVLITLFQENVGKRVANIQEKDYQVLKQLLQVCIDKKVGEMLSVYDAKQQLVASGFFLKHQQTATILVSATDFKNRKNGANTFLIDRSIHNYQKDCTIFNFGGSSMQSIANYFLSFGAKSQNYFQIHYKNWPFLLRLFRQHFFV